MGWQSAGEFCEITTQIYV